MTLRLHLTAAELACMDQQIRSEAKGHTPRESYDLCCLMCSRSGIPFGADLKLTEAEAAALKPSRCAVCGGRMLLRPDIGRHPLVTDPSAPSRLSTRPGYKAALG
jgi:hypothetical protein